MNGAVAENQQAALAPALGPSQRNWKFAALALWLLPILVISGMVIANPLRHTVTNVYHNAVDQWNARATVIDSFYLPQFIVLFMPFHMLPLAIGDLLWRVLGYAGLALGFFRLTNLLFGREQWRRFTLISIPMMLLMLGAVRNGQANAHLAACFLLAAACLLEGKWWPAVVFLVLSVAVKPLGVVACGLAFLCYPRMRWRLVIGAVFLMLLPFLFSPPKYAKEQTIASFINLHTTESGSEHRFSSGDKSGELRKDTYASTQHVAEHRFADFSGLLWPLGVPISGKMSTLIRVAAGGAAALLCWMLRKKLNLRDLLLLWFTATAAYLMIFNPMTETNSYVIFAPVLGVWIWRCLEDGEIKIAYALAAMLLSMSLARNILHFWFNGDVCNTFANAWLPAMAIVFLCLIGWRAISTNRVTRTF